jgi:hypothetical protein
MEVLKILILDYINSMIITDKKLKTEDTSIILLL